MELLPVLGHGTASRFGAWNCFPFWGMELLPVLGLDPGISYDDDELMLNVLSCQLSLGSAMMMMS